jgi:hypothetical protein
VRRTTRPTREDRLAARAIAVVIDLGEGPRAVAALTRSAGGDRAALERALRRVEGRSQTELAAEAARLLRLAIAATA